MAEWFRKKRVGFGISPAGWQGWLVTLIIVGVVAVMVSMALSR